MNDIEKKDIILNGILIPALMKLYQIDYDNIRFGVSERNICARLAHHMENIMRDYDQINNQQLFEGYYADVEYNRMGNGDLKMFENSKHVPQTMVSDLLIQSRGQERNFLAVEMKRKGNKKHVEEDKQRLESLVSSSKPYEEKECVHDTLLGAFITYSPTDVNILLFENIGGQGRQTSEIILKCAKSQYNSSSALLSRDTNI